MRWISFLLFFLGAMPSSAYAFDPAGWTERCLSHAAELESGFSTTLEIECMTEPLEICQFTEDPSDCVDEAFQFIERIASDMRSELPRSTEGVGFTPKIVNNQLERIFLDEYDLCTPEFIEGFELRFEAGFYPATPDMQQVCKFLNEAYSISEMLSAKRLIEKMEARK